MPVEELEEEYGLACTEVRGGNHLAQYSATLPGLCGWIACKPLEPSPRGGDLYYMSACSKGIIARVVLADVSGHGDTVSSVAVTLYDALRQNVDRREQAAMLGQLNTAFLDRALGEKYATAVMMSFHVGKGELLFTSAGHLPPLVYRAVENKWSLLFNTSATRQEKVDMPLGMKAGTSYTEMAVPLEFGDLLILYTDGVSEALNEAGEQLGLRGLRAMAKGLPVDSTGAAGRALLAALESYRGSAPPDDDETIVILQRRPVAP